MAKAFLGVASTTTATVLGVVTFRDVGEAIVFVAAVIASLGVIARTRPARWLARVMIGDPLKHWIHETFEAIAARVIEVAVAKYEGRMKSLLDALDARLRAVEEAEEAAGGP